VPRALRARGSTAAQTSAPCELTDCRRWLQILKKAELSAEETVGKARQGNSLVLDWESREAVWRSASVGLARCEGARQFD